MDLEIKTEIDREHSIDPSYMVRYQVFEKGSFIGDGVAQYHRLASHNDYRVPATIKRLDGSPLDPGAIEVIKKEIERTAENSISKR